MSSSESKTLATPVKRVPSLPVILPDALRIVDGQGDVEGAGQGDGVQPGVCRAAHHDGEAHRVDEALAGNEIARLEICFEQGADRRAGAEALVELLLILGRRAGGIR